MSEIALPLKGVPELPLGGRLLGDEPLAKLAARGNDRAFAALYERHHQAIYRYCRSILHNDQDAQDAMQSAMTRAYAALRAHERELAVKPWLFRIAHNEAISIVRKRRPEQALSEETEQLGSDVERTIEGRERLSTLVADLQALPERQRAALLMRELSGLPIVQIADALQMSPGAAKQALFEARSSLHELAQGRAMQCESVRQAISRRDGRVLRSRRIRAHLRACGECREFREAIGTRRAELAAIAPPLPAPVASALLVGVLTHGGGHGGAAVTASSPAATLGGQASSAATTAASTAPLTSHFATPLIAKGIAAIAVLAAATAGTVHFAADPLHRAGSRTNGSSGTTQSAAGGPQGASQTNEALASASTSGSADAHRPPDSTAAPAPAVSPSASIEGLGRLAHAGAQQSRTDRLLAHASPQQSFGDRRSASGAPLHPSQSGSRRMSQDGASPAHGRTPANGQGSAQHASARTDPSRRNSKPTTGRRRSANQSGTGRRRRDSHSHARRSAPTSSQGSKASGRPSASQRAKPASPSSSSASPVPAHTTEARSSLTR